MLARSGLFNGAIRSIAEQHRFDLDVIAHWYLHGTEDAQEDRIPPVPGGGISEPQKGHGHKDR